MFNRLLAVFLVMISQSAFAISESNYAEEYKERIIPLINSMEKSSFRGANNVSIHFATYTTNPNSTLCMVILPGRSEPLEKYAEVVDSLDTGINAHKFKFFLMDHRGQGSSGRMASPTDMGHADRFENYVLDLKTFLDDIVAPAGCSQKFLVAHSLGAGIAVNFMQEFPEYFDKAALSSPMLKIQTAPYSYKLARTIVLAAMAAGKGLKFAIGQKPFDAEAKDFETNTFTTSKVRFDMAMDMFDMIPQARLGGVSNRWLNEVMKSTKDIRTHYSDIKIPLRVIHAGIESYSEKSEMIRLCDEASYCKRTYLPSSKHEVFMDSDVNRDVAIHELETFFN